MLRFDVTGPHDMATKSYVCHCLYLLTPLSLMYAILSRMNSSCNYDVISISLQVASILASSMLINSMIDPWEPCTGLHVNSFADLSSSSRLPNAWYVHWKCLFRAEITY